MAVYYLAIVVEPGSVWTETFGSTDKSDVDAEVLDWRDHGNAASWIKRKTFAAIPSQSDVEAFASRF